MEMTKSQRKKAVRLFLAQLRSVRCPRCHTHLFYERADVHSIVMILDPDRPPDRDSIDYVEMCWRCRTWVVVLKTE